MPKVTFSTIRVGAKYTRHELAKLWGYEDYHAIARGVVTPQGSGLIILFVTEEKAADREPYADRLVGDRLMWEGPTDHFAEGRMQAAKQTGDEIHVFYRWFQRDPFTYKGRAEVTAYRGNAFKPSAFEMRLIP